jgi:hypothetical protein
LKQTARNFCFPISEKFRNLERWLCDLHSSGLNFDEFKPGGLHGKRAVATWNLRQDRRIFRKPVFRWSVARPSVQYRIISNTQATKFSTGVPTRAGRSEVYYLSDFLFK